MNENRNPGEPTPSRVSDPAFVKALLEHRQAFKAFLARRLPDPAIAEDILQQGFAKAATTAEGPRDAERLLPWFYQVLRHAVIDFYRARAAEARKHEAFLREVESGAWPEEDAESENSVCRCFEKLIPALKPEYGELLRRVDLGGESPGALAAEKGETANNLSVRLHRARRALKKELALCCGACAAHGCLDCTCGPQDKELTAYSGQPE